MENQMNLGGRLGVRSEGGGVRADSVFPGWAARWAGAPGPHVGSGGGEQAASALNNCLMRFASPLPSHAPRACRRACRCPCRCPSSPRRRLPPLPPTPRPPSGLSPDSSGRCHAGPPGGTSGGTSCWTSRWHLRQGAPARSSSPPPSRRLLFPSLSPSITRRACRRHSRAANVTRMELGWSRLALTRPDSSREPRRVRVGGPSQGRRLLGAMANGPVTLGRLTFPRLCAAQCSLG